jgi:hypothetical protein
MDRKSLLIDRLSDSPDVEAILTLSDGLLQLLLQLCLRRIGGELQPIETAMRALCAPRQVLRHTPPPLVRSNAITDKRAHTHTRVTHREFIERLIGACDGKPANSPITTQRSEAF